MTKYKLEQDPFFEDVVSIFDAQFDHLEDVVNVNGVKPIYVDVINDPDLANRILEFLNSDTEDLEKTAPTNG